MAYNKVDDSDSDLDSGVPIAEDNEAASLDARALVRDINIICRHVDEIIRVLRTIPLSTSRQIAEQKTQEVRMWAGQAFIDAEL